jgi:hypothetical protein
MGVQFADIHDVVSIISSKRQHSCILVYAYLHKGEEAGEGARVAKEFDDIEKMAKLQKTDDQSAADQDTAYITKLEME